MMNDEANVDYEREIWPISKISPLLKAKFTEVVVIAGGGVGFS